MCGNRTSTTAAIFPALFCCQWEPSTGTPTAVVIPEKVTTVLVYCHSGSRSKAASSALAELDYTNIYDFGGIKT